MKKAELIEKIARSRDLPPELTKKRIQQVLDIAFDELGAYFTRARVTRNQTPRFTFPGFGTFTKKKRSARRGVNPRTLEAMEIKASFTVDFKPGAELRRQLNGSSTKSGAGRSRRQSREDARPLQPREATQTMLRLELEAPVSTLAVAATEPASFNKSSKARLRPRDEVEFDGMADGYDASLFASESPPELPSPSALPSALPSGPIQRVRALPPSESEKTG
jgi:DNA-binding protein HU-beta